MESPFDYKHPTLELLSNPKLWPMGKVLAKPIVLRFSSFESPQSGLTRQKHIPSNSNNSARIAQFLQWIGEAEGDQVRIAAEAILSMQIQQDPNCQFDRLAIHAQAVADACGIRAERNEASDSISLIASMRDH